MSQVSKMKSSLYFDKDNENIFEHFTIVIKIYIPLILQKT